MSTIWLASSYTFRSWSFAIKRYFTTVIHPLFRRDKHRSPLYSSIESGIDDRSELSCRGIYHAWRENKRNGQEGSSSHRFLLFFSSFFSLICSGRNVICILTMYLPWMYAASCLCWDSSIAMICSIPDGDCLVCTWNHHEQVCQIRAKVCGCNLTRFLPNTAGTPHKSNFNSLPLPSFSFFFLPWVFLVNLMISITRILSN